MKKKLQTNIGNVAMEHHIRSGRQLAMKIGVSKNAIGPYWKNEMKRIDLTIISKIADALGCSPLDLFVLEDVETLDDDEHVDAA